MPFGPPSCDEPNHGKTVVPVYLLDMVELTIDTLKMIHAHPWMRTSPRRRCCDAIIGFTCVVTAVPWDAVGWCSGRKLFRP
jgi:hypothetical protein